MGSTSIAVVGVVALVVVAAAATTFSFLAALLSKVNLIASTAALVRK